MCADGGSRMIGSSPVRHSAATIYANVPPYSGIRSRSRPSPRAPAASSPEASYAELQCPDPLSGLTARATGKSSQVLIRFSATELDCIVDAAASASPFSSQLRPFRSRPCISRTYLRSGGRSVRCHTSSRYPRRQLRGRTKIRDGTTQIGPRKNMKTTQKERSLSA